MPHPLELLRPRVPAHRSLPHNQGLRTTRLASLRAPHHRPDFPLDLPHLPQHLDFSPRRHVAPRSLRRLTVANCLLCGEQPPDPEMWDHLRLFHPEEWGDGPLRWPDGEPVVVDLTLEPEDFE